MKRTFWRDWIEQRLGLKLRLRKRRPLAGTACVALGLATAWGSEAEAEVMFRVQITPAHDLMDAFVYYGNNATGPTLRSLGPLPANETYDFVDTVTASDLYRRSDEDVPPLFAPTEKYELGYAVGGLYQREDGFGVTLSFPNSTPIDNQLSWEELVAYASTEHFDQEQDIVEQYFDKLKFAPLHWTNTEVSSVFFEYTQRHNDVEFPDQYRDERYLTRYGEPTTMFSFRDTRFAGTAIVQRVPEPSSVFTILVLAGAAIAVLRSQDR